MLRESRDIFLVSLEVDFKKKKREYQAFQVCTIVSGESLPLLTMSVLKQKSKSRGLPSEISMATSRQETGAQYPAVPRTTADNPDADSILV